MQINDAGSMSSIHIVNKYVLTIDFGTYRHVRMHVSRLYKAILFHYLIKYTLYSLDVTFI